MDSPVRKMLKRNDYARHKLLRKIKRLRKARVELEKKAAEKELKKKLKVRQPKFDDGKDALIDPVEFRDRFNNASVYRRTNTATGKPEYVDDNNNSVETIGWDENGRQRFRSKDGRIGYSFEEVPAVVIKPNRYKQDELVDTSEIRTNRRPQNEDVEKLIKDDEKLNEFWQYDVLPRFKNSHPNLDEKVYDVVLNALSSPQYVYHDGTGKTGGLNSSVYIKDEQIPTPYYNGRTRFNDVYLLNRPTIVHENTHNYRLDLLQGLLPNNVAFKYNDGLLYTGYTPEEKKLLDLYKLNYYNSKNSNSPLRSNIVESGTTNAELRYRLWSNLRDALKRTPTILELNDYIDRYDDESLVFDLYDSNDYGKKAVRKNTRTGSNYDSEKIKKYSKQIKNVLKNVAYNNSNNAKNTPTRNEIYFADKGKNPIQLRF